MLPIALSAFPHGQTLLFRQKRLLHVVDALSASAVSPFDFLHLALPSPNYSISNTGFRSALPSVLSFSNDASIKKKQISPFARRLAENQVVYWLYPAVTRNEICFLSVLYNSMTSALATASSRYLSRSVSFRSIFSITFSRGLICGCFATKMVQQSS